MIKQRKKRVATIINPASIINPPNHHHQASLHHQPTHQNPKTTNQNHQNPLIKIIKTIDQNPLIKIIKTTDQNPKTIKQRKKIAMAIDESFGKRGDWQWHNCGERAVEISGGKERVR